MPFPWLTQTDLEDRIGSELVRRLYDDDKDGVPDPGPVDRVLRDACSFVAGGLGPHYTVALLTTMATVPEEIVRVSLDVAEAYAAKRYPRVVKRDWIPLMNEARLDIKQIRTGAANLGVTGSPEPSELAQGNAYINGEDDPDNYPDTFFKTGFGSFGEC